MVEERISNLQAEVGFHFFSLILKLELCWLQVIALNNSFDALLTQITLITGRIKSDAQSVVRILRSLNRFPRKLTNYSDFGESVEY